MTTSSVLVSWGYLAAVRDTTRLPIAMGSYGNHDWLHIAISLHKKSKMYYKKNNKDAFEAIAFEFCLQIQTNNILINHCFWYFIPH